tara:strand:+ start:752 stop:1819 length:1068 start_codon:yes stop_codon:yes gene_type:complete
MENFDSRKYLKELKKLEEEEKKKSAIKQWWTKETMQLLDEVIDYDNGDKLKGFVNSLTKKTSSRISAFGFFGKFGLKKYILGFSTKGIYIIQYIDPFILINKKIFEWKELVNSKLIVNVRYGYSDYFLEIVAQDYREIFTGEYYPEIGHEFSLFTPRLKKFIESNLKLDYEDNHGNDIKFKLEGNISNIPESKIKKIDDLDTTEEIKNEIKDSTLFFDNEGNLDTSKGAGKKIAKDLNFIKNVNGIDINEIVFDLHTFQKMDNNTPPYSDINGKWYNKFGHTIMKCFSDDKFEGELDKLLQKNKINKDFAKVFLTEDNILSGTEPITYYAGNGFNIEIPPSHDGNPKLIVLKKPN